MKHLVILLLVSSSLKSFAQTADAIVGKWINIPKQNTIIEVYKVKDEYKGKILWTKEHDPKKPEGFIILDKLRYDNGSKKWKDGKIREPDSGSTYSAEARIMQDGTLTVFGYMGIKLLGSTKIFKRIN
jgi:uncharacterized protein (DUF2147 family)